ncbi:Hsp70 protein-domain-containing protein [Blastocladiella britannica]|nr:Hsp70 protein-domain-containing protein [Blastocladiella britannica]
MLRTATLAALAALLLLCLASVAHASTPVIGIDYGSEWFKVALVRPGKALDVVLNRESKRKTHSLLTLRTDERFFGSDAAALAPRFPTTTFVNLKSLMGQNASSDVAAAYKAIYPVSMTTDPERGTVRLAGLATNDIYSVEELVAMQLTHARMQAEESIQRPVTDTVITIPPHFGQAERKAMLAAAELAGLRVLALLHDGSAVALNYAMSRKFPTPQTHIFFDMGAGSSSATLVRFEQERKATRVTTLATSYDATLGGSTLDAVLADHLGAAFEATAVKLATPVSSNPRARVKLLREAARIKSILSVNSQAMASIESVHEDRNLRVLVTRAELEAMAAPLQPRVAAVLAAVQAHPAAVNVSSVVLVGGGTRVPAVQRWIEEEATGGANAVAKNVNGDEAAVLGAAWRAATVARKFRVQREISLADPLPYNLMVAMAGVVPAGKPATVLSSAAVVVPHTGAPGVLKTVTWKKSDPLHLVLSAAGRLAGSKPVPLALIHTADTNASVTEQKLTLKVDGNGVVHLTNATATYVERGSPGVLGIGASPDRNASMPLSATLEDAVPPMSPARIAAAAKRLRGWDARERERRDKEAAKNALEAMVYGARDKTEDSESTYLAKVATAAELDRVAKLARETGDWLDDAPETELTVVALKTKRAGLAAALAELTERWTRVQDQLAALRDALAEVGEPVTWVDNYENRDVYDRTVLAAKIKDVDTQVAAKRAAEEEARAKKEAEVAEARRQAEELLAKLKREADAATANLTSSDAVSSEPASSSSSPLPSTDTEPAAAGDNDDALFEDAPPLAEESDIPTPPPIAEEQAEEVGETKHDEL